MAQGPFRLGEIVGRLGGELLGDPAVEVRGLATLRGAQPGDLSFLVQPKYRSRPGGHPRLRGDPVAG